MKHDWRVYYEDTDAGGVVYYANYLRFAERGRTEWLRALGFDQETLRRDHGVLFAVRRCTVDYARPARLDDLLTIETLPGEVGRVRFAFAQRVLRGGETLARVAVEIACVDTAFRPARIPEALAARLRAT